ncbi:MAG: radical SAM protein [Candidatus Aenigmarchaeota archaeon]|nr:radical SAM protein [Candidatus Aenigmarchaeota archaeon]
MFRRDIIGALEDPLVKKILPRYVKVAKNEAWANFQIAKRVVFDFDKSLSNEQLWKTHSKLMKKFYEIREVLDKKKLKLKELEIPRYSLLDLKIMLTKEILKSCELCERKCHVNRLEGQKGECRVGGVCLISSEFIHMGEEYFISPSHTIFFMGCSFHCQYCQNWTISQWFEDGYAVTPREIAKAMERRRESGARNANFVGGNPDQSLLWILEALKCCDANIPTVWNSNFYMTEKVMQILDGIVDLHLPDFKYGNDECALRLSKVPRYFEVVSRNHLLAIKQAEVTVRHLVLPNHVECCTKPILNWIAENIRDRAIVNIMPQFRPEFKANQYTDINRSITQEEFEEAVNYAKKLKINYIT